MLMFDLTDSGDHNFDVADQWYGKTAYELTWTVELASGHMIVCIYTMNTYRLNIYVEEPDSDKLVEVGLINFSHPVDEDTLFMIMDNWVGNVLNIYA